MSALQLYSTLGDRIRPFQTVVPGQVRIYVCGVTPYDVTHLGHAFSYVQFDTLRRYLVSRGYNVKYVQNVTDIDDDMIMVSKRLGGKPIPEIRDENLAILRNDLDRLNVLRPSAYPFATDYIPQIIETTAKLLERGHAYEVEGDVFFDTTTFERYGALNGETRIELETHENVESKREHKKRNKLDFLLWQIVDPGDPNWESPWGAGRPGWSIECTAMSVANLGEQIDIHGGGSDLRYFHHENEIAQAECASGRSPFCGYWLHNGMLQLDGVKMSKSLGNLVLARNLMQEFEADHLRLYLLGNHLRVTADYRDGAMPKLAERYDRFKQAAARGVAELAEDSSAGHERLSRVFTLSMDSDFNVPGGLDVLDTTARRVLAGNADAGEAAELRNSLNVLGFAFAGARGPANDDFNP